jgi:hypothetical protein
MNIGLYTTAAFISAGMHRDVKQLDQAKDLLGTGCFELVTTGVEWTEFVDMMYRVGGMITGDHPGVFDYEVTEEFGFWYVDEVLATEKVPTVEACRAKLTALGMAFFVRDDNRDQLVENTEETLRDAFSRIDPPKQPEV